MGGQVQSDRSVGKVVMPSNYKIKFTIEVHSEVFTFSSLLHIGDSSFLRHPAMYLNRNSVLSITTTDCTDSSSQNMATFDTSTGWVAGSTHVLELHVTPDTKNGNNLAAFLIIDGELQPIQEAHSCYSGNMEFVRMGDPWSAPADVSITNFMILEIDENQ